MKKVISIGILLVGIGLSNHTVKAEITNAESTGVIEFTEPDGQTVKPGTPGGPNDIIETPGGGKNTNGLLKIHHVPDFQFGKVPKTAAKITANAKVEEYTYAMDQVKKKHYIPPFVQISDYTDSLTSPFRLQVSGTKFTSSKSGHQLSDATINFSGEKLFNNVHPSVTHLKGGGFQANPKVLNLSTYSTEKITIMGTLANETTNGTVSSSVFDNDYLSDKIYTADDVTTGVTFVKKAGSMVKSEEYRSTLTWTLENVPFS